MAKLYLKVIGWIVGFLAFLGVETYVAGKTGEWFGTKIGESIVDVMVAKEEA